MWQRVLLNDLSISFRLSNYAYLNMDFNLKAVLCQTDQSLPITDVCVSRIFFLNYCNTVV